MERVKVLIDKLVQQQQRNESVEALLITTQLLQNELLLLQRKNTTPVTSKVAVVMPSGANPIIKREPKPAPVFEAEEPVPAQEQTHIPVKEEIPTPVQKMEEPAQVAAEPQQPLPPVYRVPPVPHMRPPVSQVTPAVEETPVLQQAEPATKDQDPISYNNINKEPAPELPAPVMTAPENPEHEAYLPPKQHVQETTPEPEKIVHPLVLENPFDAMEETPTLAQYQPPKKDLKLQKEINDLIGEQKETLNDRLKENKKELAHLLKETPIKDLRKAIGVNDRFVFVNELFRGDETMYERSIKTINGFHILPEAEYWINRELKVKLGWDDYKDSVQHFYHLVRRRFS